MEKYYCSIYTPDAGDVLAGSVVLSLYAQTVAPCAGEDTDALMLTIDQCTYIGENENKSINLEVFPTLHSVFYG